MLGAAVLRSLVLLQISAAAGLLSPVRLGSLRLPTAPSPRAHALLEGGRRLRQRAAKRSRTREARDVNPHALTCAVCAVESSSEVSFWDHINGAAHIKRAGQAGFAGLVPNKAGLIPVLSDPDLRASAQAFELGVEQTLPPASRRGQSQYHPNALKCACCEVESSSEASFVDHIYGASHSKRAGRPGFAGLVANEAGRVPPLQDPMLRAEADAFARGLPLPVPGLPDSATVDDGVDEVLYEGAPRQAGPWLPPVRELSVSQEAIVEVRQALDQLATLSRPPSPSGRRTDGRTVGTMVDVEGGNRKGWRSQPSRLGRRRGPPRGMPAVPAALVDGGPLAATREALPVARYRSQILAALEAEVSIVEGETGSGKTTQVAQYVLEAAAADGRLVNMVCTQPRRISAIGVAERVAAERGEQLGGGAGAGAVGYAVRGESRQSASTSLLFCTTGVLLRMLEDEPTLPNVTHVLVDEVPTRSRPTLTLHTLHTLHTLTPSHPQHPPHPPHPHTLTPSTPSP